MLGHCIYGNNARPSFRSPTYMRRNSDSIRRSICNNLQVEGDNQLVIRVLQGTVHILWKIHSLIPDTQEAPLKHL